MRNVLSRLLTLVVETLDRNLVMVPEIDDYHPPVAVRRPLDPEVPPKRLADRPGSPDPDNQTHERDLR